MEYQITLLDDYTVLGVSACMLLTLFTSWLVGHHQGDIERDIIVLGVPEAGVYVVIVTALP